MKRYIAFVLLANLGLGSDLECAPFMWYPLWGGFGQSCANILYLDQVGSEVWLTFNDGINMDPDTGIPSCIIDIQCPTLFVTTVFNHYGRGLAALDGVIDRTIYDSLHPNDSEAYSFAIGSGWINLARPAYSEYPDGINVNTWSWWYIYNYPWIHSQDFGWWYVIEAGIVWNSNSWWIFDMDVGWFWTTRNMLIIGYGYIPELGWKHIYSFKEAGKKSVLDVTK